MAVGKNKKLGKKGKIAGKKKVRVWPPRAARASPPAAHSPPPANATRRPPPPSPFAAD